MRRQLARLVIVAVIAIVILALLVIARPWLKRSEPPAELPKVRLGIQDNATCALVFIAAGEELFKQEGVDVTIRRYPSGKLALMGMLEGEVDIATVADMPVMSHSFLRNDFAVFANIAGTRAGAWIVARKDKGINTPADLRGKTIGTQKNSAVHFFLSAFLLKHAIPEDEVNILFMKAVDLAGALERGEIDAFSMRNPFIGEAKKKLGDNAIEFFEPGVYRQAFNLAAKREFLDGSLDEVCRVLHALISAEEIASGDDTEAIRIAADGMGKGREAGVSDDWSRYTYAVTLEQSIFITLEDQARWAVQQGTAPTSTIPNFLEFIDVRALETVRPQAVTVAH